MRYVTASALAALAAWCAVIAYGPLHNLWSDYQDSSTSTYLLFGLPPLALAIAAVAVAVRVLRKP